MFDKTRRAGKNSVRGDSNPRATQIGATSLMEDGVSDAAGKYLGEVEEIILDIGSGCVRYVVLALGGFLGIGCKRFAVPWSVVTPDLNYQRCVLDITQMTLMAVPVSDDDPWLQRAASTRGLEYPFLLHQHTLLGSTGSRGA